MNTKRSFVFIFARNLSTEMLLSPLPHGIAGPLDEILIVVMVVAYLILSVLASRRKKGARPQETPPSFLTDETEGPPVQPPLAAGEGDSP